MANFYAFYPPGGGSNASVGLNGGVAPASSTEIGYIDNSGNLQPVTSSAPLPVAVVSTPTPQNVNIADVLGAPPSATNPLFTELAFGGVAINPQNIRALTSSDTVTVVQPTGTNLHAVIDSSALPTGAATAANQATANASLASIDTKLTAPLSVTGPLTDAQLRASPVPVTVSSAPSNQSVNLTQVGGSAIAIGQALMAASLPVAIASDQSTLPISAASLPLPSGAATSALQTSGNASLSSILANQTNGTQVVQVSNFPGTQPVSGTVTANQGGTWNINNISGTISLPTGAATAANQSTGNASLASIDGKLNSLGQKTMANSMPVVIASDQSAVTVAQQVGSSSSVTSVAASASNVTLLSSNANRIGAMFYNDSTSIAYVKLGNTASSSSYTIQMAPGSYYELPFPNKMYTGQIDAIWVSATGNMRVTELS